MNGSRHIVVRLKQESGGKVLIIAAGAGVLPEDARAWSVLRALAAQYQMNRDSGR